MDKIIFNDLNKIFQKYFNNSKIKLNQHTSAESIKGWDSLAQVGLILMIERKFKTRFSVKEVEVLQNVGQMVSLIKKKLKKK